MHIRTFLHILVSACTMSAGVLNAQPLQQRDPGLWEIRMNQGSPLMGVMQSMQGMLDVVPAEQRKQMEAMLEKSGVSFSDPTLVKQCLTPEMAARELEPYSDDPDMACTTTHKKMTKTTAEFTYTCQNEDGKWAGKGRIWDASAKGYKSEMIMEGTAGGRPVKMDMGHEARWVSTDCQGIEPVEN